jgi:hypothetical protein
MLKSPEHALASAAGRRSFRRPLFTAMADAHTLEDM